MDTMNRSMENLEMSCYGEQFFTTLQEAQVVIESYLKNTNQFRPHSSLNHKSTAPETIQTKTWKHNLRSDTT